MPALSRQASSLSQAALPALPTAGGVLGPGKATSPSPLGLGNSHLVAAKAHRVKEMQGVREGTDAAARRASAVSKSGTEEGRRGSENQGSQKTS